MPASRPPSRTADSASASSGTWAGCTTRSSSCARDPLYRSHHLDEISFGLIYAFTENFVLPLSHDEVVHGKGSLLGKMPGGDREKFANLRLLFGHMFGHPGKKLIFAGGEFAQWDEWKDADVARLASHRNGCRTTACSGWSPTATASTANCRRCTRATRRARASSGFSTTTERNAVCAWVRWDAARATPCRRRVQLFGRAARRLPDRRAAGRDVPRVAQHRCGHLRRRKRRATWASPIQNR